jgi:hypothetical protein
MWPTIDRARRRLSGGSSTPADPPPTPGSVDVSTTIESAPEDVVIILRGHEIDRLRQALQRSLGNLIERPDTPHRIERALSIVLAGGDALGRPRVLRRPAGISSPESWEIHLDGVDRATATAVREAGRTGRFA